MNPALVVDTVNILSFGEILWDIIDGEEHLGGAAFNLAAHAARLGLNTELISRVGADALGSRAVAEAKRLGVGSSFVAVDRDYPTGTVTVTVSPGGQPEYEIGYPAAWDYIDFDEQALARWVPHAVCFGTLAQRSPTSRKALVKLLQSADGARTFYDVNLRQQFYGKEVIEWGFNRADVVKMNDEECRLIGNMLLGTDFDEAKSAAVLREVYKNTIILVTLGASGCLVVNESGATHIPGQAVKVVDTIGAGDAFSATFLACWLRGVSPQSAASLANRIGAYVASQRGAVPDYDEAIKKQSTWLSGLRSTQPEAWAGEKELAPLQ